MFDFGFQELMVIFVVALVVIGPQRMPGLVAKVGRWVGKARSMARQFREQLENEVNLDELNRMTDQRAKEARAQAPSTPAPPPELGGAPITADTTDSLAGNSYPYAAQPGDDTYSHAHALGDAPMPYTPEIVEPAPAPALHESAPLPDATTTSTAPASATHPA